MKRVLKARHGGEEDFTVMTQGEMLESFGRVFAIVSAAVAGIGVPVANAVTVAVATVVGDEVAVIDGVALAVGVGVAADRVSVAGAVASQPTGGCGMP